MENNTMFIPPNINVSPTNNSNQRNKGNNSNNSNNYNKSNNKSNTNGSNQTKNTENTNTIKSSQHQKKPETINSNTSKPSNETSKKPISNTIEGKKITPNINERNGVNANSSKPINKINSLKKNSTETKQDFSKLIIGFNDRGIETYIPSKNRTSNLMVLGSKFTGKTSRVLPMLLNQDLLDSKCGATIIVSKNEVAYNLYALAKSYKRDAILLKPSINNEISNNLLWKDDYQYDYINEHIINYKEAIKKKQIVIIDMELLKHKIDGIKSVAMILQQLELDMQETDITQKTPHYLYVDDAQYFLPFLENILYYGDEFNVGTTLFLQSRKQLQRKTKSYETLINDNVRNILLLNTLADEDIEYYKERFFEYKQAKHHYKRSPNELLYEILDAGCNKRCGLADISKSLTLDWESIYKKAKTLRTKLLKEKRLEFEKKILNSLKNKYSEDDYLEEDAHENILNEEEKELILDVEKELSSNLPDIQESSNIDLGSVEPNPVDMSLFEENSTSNTNPIQIEDYPKETLEKPDTVNLEEPKKNIRKIKEDKVKEIIKIREKSVKRNVSTKIFNNYKSDLKYFEENFDFKFD